MKKQIGIVACSEIIVFVKIGYGSCSGCDTLEAIRSYKYDKPTKKQTEGYMTLALHIVQGLKPMGNDYNDIV